MAEPASTVVAPVVVDESAETRPTLMSRKPWREALVVLALYATYSLVRLAATGDLEDAEDAAHGIRMIERWLGIDVERSWNGWISGHPTLMLAVSLWYATLHWVATAAVLVFLWLRRPRVYRPLFAILVGTTMSALAFFVLIPTAPPRLIDGFVDVLEAAGNLGYWDHGATGEDGLSASTNELAAFPSLHAGWSLWVCLAVFASTRRLWWRLGGVAYALTTAAVVIVSANHWVIDVLAGWALVAGWAWVVSRWCRRRSEGLCEGTTAVVP
ncbi:phosphatase PAP2 family protein [Demequina salsinemoris]|uniref:phosphatase PAP2 family protein n=1 Tax=Demequina salsinemoris TaxID=577470 RepID=UPI000784C846|nr:phosphatase PAP2 family protein [Demequina salsinemoris]